MNRGVALLLGLITVLPIASICYMSWFSVSDEQRDLLWSLDGALVFLGFIAFYMVYLFRTSHVPRSKRALWAVVLVLGHVFAMPVFWYHYVWKPNRGGGSAS